MRGILMMANLKFGYISEYDANKGMARVEFPDMATGDTDKFVSGWLNVAVSFTLDNQEFNPMASRQHVACMVDERCEFGVVLCAIYDETNPPGITDPKIFGRKFADGTEITYNVGTHELKVSGPKQINITCEKATIDAQQGVDITGDVSVTGKITATSDIESTAGSVKAAVDVSANTTHLKTHVHPTPSGASGAPTP